MKENRTSISNLTYPHHGPVYLVNDEGEQISLVVEYNRTGIDNITQHERFEEVDPNDCFIVVSTNDKLIKGTGTTVPVHIENTKAKT